MNPMSPRVRVWATTLTGLAELDEVNTLRLLEERTSTAPGDLGKDVVI